MKQYVVGGYILKIEKKPGSFYVKREKESGNNKKKNLRVWGLSTKRMELLSSGKDPEGDRYRKTEICLV